MTTIQAPPEIRTERLRLRRPERRDVNRIHELANDWDVVRMTTRMPWPYTRRDAVEFVDRVQASRSGDAHTFLIEGPDGPAGLLGFFTEAGQRLPEIGYWLGRPYWGRGYATEAADAAMLWASREWKRRGVRSGHFRDNDASGRVLCKAGFLYTGEVIPKMSRARGEVTPTRMMVWLA